MLITKLVTTVQELEQIAALSAANQSKNITEETRQKEGFVTWLYPLDVLQTLHAIQPSVITMDGDKLAGYAIALTKECAPFYPALAADISYHSTVRYKDRPLLDYAVYWMGQICVDIDYRGMGVVDMLYQFHRHIFSPKYDMLITEISVRNPRSLKAHQKAGFKVIDTHEENGDEWLLVVYDWA